jgi:uncharacterized protein
MTFAELLLYGSIYAFIGIFAGLMAGIFGIGGGILVVPGLVLIFQLNQLVPESLVMYVAAGTSLTVMIFTSLVSIKAHHKIAAILWPVFNKLWPGIVLGVITGALLAEFIPTYWLKFILAVFLLFIAFKMLTKHHARPHVHFPANWINKLITFLIGMKSGLLGIGGGTLIIPYLAYCGVKTRQIPPVSNLCTLIVGFIGALVFLITGRKEMAAIPYATGYIYWPAVLLIAIPSSIIAPLGAKLNYLLPVKQLKYAFIVILLLTAIKMFF